MKIKSIVLKESMPQQDTKQRTNLPYANNMDQTLCPRKAVNFSRFQFCFRNGTQGCQCDQDHEGRPSHTPQEKTAGMPISDHPEVDFCNTEK
jgi:hypothetical protein